MTCVLICGGRHLNKFEAANIIDNDLVDAMSENAPDMPPVSRVIHGAAKGADEAAGIWAKSENIPCQAFPANWKKHGKAAGPIRNRQMLDQGKPDIVIALPGGRGTANMMQQAADAGLLVIEIGKYHSPKKEDI